MHCSETTNLTLTDMNEAIRQQLNFLKEAIRAYENDPCVINMSSLVTEMDFLLVCLKLELNDKRNKQ